MSNPGLIKTHIADGAIGKFRIVAQGASDGAVKQGTSGTDSLLGVTEGFAYVAGDRPSIVRSGIADVEYGGVVTRGAPLTSDASGRAIVAAPAVGVNMRTIGFAEVSGVVGDIGSVLVAPNQIQG
ncbi:DUF2190 domain-containing protein [Cupriavidus basilensis]|uniref:DUF2190 domain-containing protein n=1 Tax=Cupriavidus basilensis TaxID=68895 RepID=UPI00284F3D19|nr:DUF2190 domain-containing protein [Cupriavidus basilensis]MDR3382305.1 DUF2190 domain-containing protein [Cupriavidus basilensis]